MHVACRWLTWRSFWGQQKGSPVRALLQARNNKRNLWLMVYTKTSARLTSRLPASPALLRE